MKKSFLKIGIGILLSNLVFLSCRTTNKMPELEALGFYNDKAKVTTLSNGKTKVVVIGVAHIGTKTYYKDVRKKVDSLKTLGFDFLYEWAQYDENLPAEKKLEYQQKFRKLVGFHIPDEGYLNKKTNKIGPLQLPKSHHLINQPDYKRLGIDMKKDIHADFQKNVLIDRHEERFGAILLDSCDLNTPLDKDYLCDRTEEISDTYAVIEIRNQKIVDELSKLKNDKIAIIYGENHTQGVLELLKTRDSNWKMVEN